MGTSDFGPRWGTCFLRRLELQHLLMRLGGPDVFLQWKEKFNLRVVFVCLQENVIDGCHERLWPPVVDSHTHTPTGRGTNWASYFLAILLPT